MTPKLLMITFSQDVFRDLVGVDLTAARLAPGPYHKLTNAGSLVY